MDNKSQEEFDRLVKLNPEDLTGAERDFLNARRTYLNNEQRRVFGDVLRKEDSVEEPTGEKPELYVAKKDRV